MASVSPFEMIALAVAVLALAVVAGLFMWVRRVIRRRRRRRSSRAHARSYFNESMTREQIAAAAREERERIQAKLAAQQQQVQPAPLSDTPMPDPTPPSAEPRVGQMPHVDPTTRSSR